MADPPARILVVDDDPGIVKVLSEMCLEMGLEVRTARDGVEALKELRATGADLMLLDLAMPRLDGFAVLEKLLDEPAEPNPVVIVVTASADVAGKMRGTELGAWDFVEKPFRVPDLKRRLERVLAIRELEGGIEQSERQYWQLRSTDEATGVGTFAQLYDVLGGEFLWAKTHGKPLSCVVVSDESYGKSHRRDLKDDTARLHTVAQLVGDALGVPGRIFRVDAAELVMVLPGCSESEARQVVERVGKALSSADTLASGDFVMAGATYPHPEIEDAFVLYRAASTALTQARAQPDRHVGYFAGFPGSAG